MPKRLSLNARLTHNHDGDGDHADVLIEHLKDATRIVWAVAFVRMSGLGELLKDLEAKVAEGIAATFVVGIDFFQTDPESIRSLLALKKAAKKPGRVKVYMGCEDADDTLHPKIYVFAQDNRTTAIVGSANMTWGGLFGNHEFSAVLGGEDVNWEEVVLEWIDKCCEEGRIVPATRELVDSYETRRNVFTAHMKMAENRAHRALRAPPGNLDTLRAILATMHADETDQGFKPQVAQRTKSLETGPVVLAEIAALRAPTEGRFLALYEQLLNGIWHSGGLTRAKTTIATNGVIFAQALRALVATVSDDPCELYDLLLTFTDRIPKAGVNVMTEILHSRDAARFPVMNGNSVSSMRLAGILHYPLKPTKKSVNGSVYASFCKDANRIRIGLGLKNFSELDAVFNYAYFHAEQEPAQSPEEI